MTVHDLKCWPQYFEPLARGYKTFEIRRDDRGYRADDVLVLREWEPATKTYTGREERRSVTHVMHLCNFGPCAHVEDYVILSLAPPAAR